MLKLSIRTTGQATPWHPSPTGRWFSDRGWFEPYRHPVVEHTVLTDGVSTCLVVRERHATLTSPWWPTDPRGPALTAEAYRSAVADARTWPLDVTVAEIRPDAIVLTAGMWGTAPLYLVEHGGVLAASWDCADLRVHLSPERLTPAAVARTLTYWRRYSTDTIYQGLRLLTERTEARAGVDGLHIQYPPEAVHSRARELRADADPVGAFEDMLTHVITKRPIDDARTAVELSGGQDSAAVAMTLAALRPATVTTGAMRIPGQPGIQQMRRRRYMRGSGRFGPDLSVVGADHPPLTANGPTRTGLSVHPDDEAFGEAVGAMLDQFAANGLHTSYGGTGGDELVALRERERDHSLNIDEWLMPDWLSKDVAAALVAGEEDLAPASPISEVTLMGFASSSAEYLRRGIWHVNPLADPELIRFAEWLPADWRRRKRIMRERLRRLGMPEEVVEPPLRENLAEMMNIGLREHGLPILRRMLTDGGVLIDLGYIDPDRLGLACDAAERTDGELDRYLYPTIALECILRNLAGTPVLAAA